jgi:tetratricopeptide (TPR) repeat protein
MRTFALLLTLCLAASVMSAAETSTSPSYSDAMVAVFVFGNTGGWMADGFAVGDGQYIVTTGDVVSEVIPAGTDASGKPASTSTKLQAKYVIVVSPWTGDAYRAEVKTPIDSARNLAILKLPMAGLPSAPLAGSDKFQQEMQSTIGELFSGGQVGRRWETSLVALTSGSTSKLSLKEWTARNAAFAESKSVNWLFISKIEPQDLAPRASMVWRKDAVVGLYNGKLAIGEGDKAPTYGQCLISPEIIRALGKAGINADSLKKVPAPTIKQDSMARQGLQLTWATLTNVILGKSTEALKTAQSLHDLRPESATANLLLGVAQTGNGKFDDAVKTLDKAIKLDADVPGGYSARGAALAAQGKPKEAEADLRKAVDKSPGDSKPLLALAGLVASDKTRVSESAEIAAKAVQVDPQNPWARLALGVYLKTVGHYDQAITEIKEALKIAPNWGQAKAALGATYEAKGDLAGAEKLYRELSEAEPKNPDALFTLASFLADHDKKSEAREIVTKILGMEKLPAGLQAAVEKLQKKLE